LILNEGESIAISTGRRRLGNFQYQLLSAVLFNSGCCLHVADSIVLDDEFYDDDDDDDNAAGADEAPVTTTITTAVTTTTTNTTATTDRDGGNF